MNKYQTTAARTDAEALTIAYVAIGAHEAFALPELASGHDAVEGELGLIHSVITEALLLDRVADFFDVNDGHSGVFAYEVAEPFGKAYASAILRLEPAVNPLAILRAVMLDAQYEVEALDVAFASMADVDPRVATFAQAANEADTQPLSESMNDRFAEKVIGDRAVDYQELELQGVRKSSDGACTVSNEDPQFFSVYARLKPVGDDRGVACVGDFGTYALAREYANELAQRHGWPVLDYVPFRLRQDVTHETQA